MGLSKRVLHCYSTRWQMDRMFKEDGFEREVKEDVPLFTSLQEQEKQIVVPFTTVKANARTKTCNSLCLYRSRLSESDQVLICGLATQEVETRRRVRRFARTYKTVDLWDAPFCPLHNLT